MEPVLPFQTNKSLKELSTFGIGGQAKFFIEVYTYQEMKTLLLRCHQQQIPYLIIGKGSNCLFDDQGFNGVLILNKIDFLETPKLGVFHVGAGYSFSLLGSQTARLGWSGLEFAAGIPGSIGGAVFMNAGANGSDTSQSLISVDFMTPQGELYCFKKSQVSFAYRFSSFQKMPGAIVGASFALTEDKFARQKQLNLLSYRQKTQPLKEKSAGCIFRNPLQTKAGALIDKSGLKGLKMGGAKISEKHANFIINEENATSKDVLSLIQMIQNKIKQEMGIDLESEIRYIPYNFLNS